MALHCCSRLRHRLCRAFRQLQFLPVRTERKHTEKKPVSVTGDLAVSCGAGVSRHGLRAATARTIFLTVCCGLVRRQRLLMLHLSWRQHWWTACCCVLVKRRGEASSLTFQGREFGNLQTDVLPEKTHSRKRTHGKRACPTIDGKAGHC